MRPLNFICSRDCEEAATTPGIANWYLLFMFAVQVTEFMDYFRLISVILCLWQATYFCFYSRVVITCYIHGFIVCKLRQSIFALWKISSCWVHFFTDQFLLVSLQMKKMRNHPINLWPSKCPFGVRWLGNLLVVCMTWRKLKNLLFASSAQSFLFNWPTINLFSLSWDDGKNE